MSKIGQVASLKIPQVADVSGGFSLIMMLESPGGRATWLSRSAGCQENVTGTGGDVKLDPPDWGRMVGGCL